MRGLKAKKRLALCLATVISVVPACAWAADTTFGDLSRPGKVVLPLLGELDTQSLSLPVLTIVLAAVDSFNPCAFFVLLFLLSLLVHSGSRRRMALIGGTFIFFSGAVYFLFISALLQVFLIIGSLPVITTAAGGIAIIISIVNIKDFFLFKKGVSLGIPEEAKPGLFRRMRELLKSTSTVSAVAGTAVLAAAANSYELLCTAGFPLVFSRTLTLHRMPPAGYYAYAALYCVVYTIPLLAILGVFIFTLGSRKLTEWQGRKLKLASGLMMLCLGLALLIEPSILTDASSAVLILVAALAASFLVIEVTRRLRPTLPRT